MNQNVMNEIRDKSRLVFGLLTILKDDVDTLRYDANYGDILNLLGSTKDAKQTVTQMKEVIEEIEYILFVNAI